MYTIVLKPKAALWSGLSIKQIEPAWPEYYLASAEWENKSPDGYGWGGGKRCLWGILGGYQERLGGSNNNINTAWIPVCLVYIFVKKDRTDHLQRKKSIATAAEMHMRKLKAQLREMSTHHFHSNAPPSWWLTLWWHVSQCKSRPSAAGADDSSWKMRNHEPSAASPKRSVAFSFCICPLMKNWC